MALLPGNRILRASLGGFSGCLYRWIGTDTESTQIRISDGRPPKTSVLLLHNGLPRTPYYACTHLAKSASSFYKVPLAVTSRLTRFFWRYSKKADFCVDDYKFGKQLPDVLDNYATVLENYLNQLIPECSPFNCTYAFQYEDPLIQQTIIDLIKKGMQRLILLPLYPHYWCFHTGKMLNSVTETLQKYTIPLIIDGMPVENHRVRTLSHVSFECSAVDRWGTHPAISNFWCDLLSSKVGNRDSILFVAPQMRGYNSTNYSREVWSSCQRLIDYLNHTVAWRIAWIGGWDQWPALSMECIDLQLRMFRRDGLERTIVVPITSLFPSFETESILPLILEMKGVEFLQPPEYSTVLAHGLAEIVKNNLMGRKTMSQASTRCRFCYSSSCLRRMAFFEPKFASSKEIGSLNDKLAFDEDDRKVLA